MYMACGSRMLTVASHSGICMVRRFDLHKMRHVKIQANMQLLCVMYFVQIGEKWRFVFIMLILAAA